ncbi:MAG: helix-turn-helix domain-containing protein [Thermoleophilaceae bacterium]
MPKAVDRSPTLLNVGQAAEFLGVSAASLRVWSDQGKLTVYRTPGGQRRYRVEDLEFFIDSLREHP